MESKFNWSEIQAYLDDNHTWREAIKQFNVSMTSLNNARRSGDLKTRDRKSASQLSVKIKGRPKASQATKDKISKIRIAFLQANPDKVPYLLNHSSKKSWPEKAMEALLIEEHIPYEYGVQKSIYKYDFCIEDVKLDLEIDGQTHTLPHVIEIDRKRDIWSKEQGWTVLRIHDNELRDDPKSVIDKVKALYYSLKDNTKPPASGNIFEELGEG